MRTFIIAVIIAVLLVGGGLIFNFSIDGIADELMAECDKISEQIEKDRFDEASENISKMEEYMDDKKTILASIINHENIDDIELCISELKGYADKKIAIEAHVRCRKLKHLLEHLPANYTITLQNVL